MLGSVKLMRGTTTSAAETEKPIFFQCADNIVNGESARIAASLTAEMEEKFGSGETARFSVKVLRGDALAGGVNGFIHWRWLYIQQLWIDPAERGKGLGGALLGRVEAEARERGCVGVYLDTFEARTAAFYERCGFERCGEIKDFPVGHSRVFLCKQLERGLSIHSENAAPNGR